METIVGVRRRFTRCAMAFIVAIALAAGFAIGIPDAAEAATLAPAQVEVVKAPAQTAAKTVKKASIAKAKVKLAKKTYTYTGKSIKPAMTVKVGKKTLKLNRDYTIANKSNTKASSKAKVVLKGKGAYKGTKTVTFKIAKAKASKLKVSFAKPFYTASKGKCPKPVPIVKLGNVKLKKNVDYTISYTGYISDCGSRVIICGKGSVKGIQYASFECSLPTKYKYSASFLCQPYSGMGCPIYIQTSNPMKNSRLSLEFKDAKGEKVETSGVITRYGDIHEGNIIGQFKKVAGGWITTYSIKEPGTYRVYACEWDKGNYYSPDRKVYLGKIKVRDYDKEYTAWRKSIIAKTTTANMTKAQKMQAVSNYLYENSRYQTCTIEDGYANLVTEAGIPHFKSMVWDSYISPYMLVRFGEDLGYPLESLYGKYPMGSAGWARYHWFAYSAADDRYYQCCQLKSTGQAAGWRTRDDIPAFNPKTYKGYIKVK